MSRPSTREEFLGRVRQEVRKTRGLFSATVTPRPRDPAALAEALRRQMAERWPHALERFREEFERVAGILHRVQSRDEVPELIGRIARERNATRVITWSRTALGWDPAPGLERQGLHAHVMPHEVAGAEEGSPLRTLIANAEIGVTGVDLALAETGSLILISGSGRPRTTSLVPDYHIAVFGKNALIESLEQVGIILESFHEDPDRTMSGAVINFITGPSRTADIELTLTRGVHGPKEVHAIFVDRFGEEL